MRVKVRFVVPNATFNNISVISCGSVFTGGGNGIVQQSNLNSVFEDLKFF